MKALWVVLLILGLIQPATDLNVRVDAVDASGHPQMSLVTTVRDANGVPVSNLTAANFEINEDRMPQARAITTVEPFVNPDVRVSVVLVIDVSGSLKGQPLADAKVAATRFLDRLSAQDRAAVIAFADKVNLDALDAAREAAFTSDKTALYKLIDGLQAGGGTPLYDAAYKAVQWVSQETIGNRAVILLTDGRDEQPGSTVASEETPIQAATRANIPVFTIGLGNQIDRGYLERLARLTGGTYQETPDSAQLAALFQNVGDLLKQQYRLTYQSGLKADGQTHRVEVIVQQAGRSAQAEAECGPLGAPISAPTSAPPSSPTLAPTHTPVIAAPSTTTATPDSAPFIIGGGALIVVVGLIGFALRRRPKVQYCLRCGQTLGPDSVCPNCGAGAGKFTAPN
jgi:VWFA-related protein